MSKVTSVNQVPATGSEAVYRVKQNMVAAGWTVKASSDGTTYNSTGDQITATSSLAATNAWFRIQDPAGRRELTFQRTTANTTWRIKFSESAKFTGGTPGSTQTPSATDEGVLLGSGTDASPTGTAFFGTDNTYKLHSISFSDALSPGSVYSVFFFTSDNTTGAMRTRFFMDGLSGGHASDTSPVGFFVLNLSGPTFLGTDYATVTNPPNPAFFAWRRYGLSSAAFTNWRQHLFLASGAPYSAVIPPRGLAGPSPNGYDGTEDVYKIIHLFRSTADGNNGYKGLFQRFAFNGNSSRVYPDTLNLATDAYVYMGTSDFVIPWENGTTPNV